MTGGTRTTTYDVRTDPSLGRHRRGFMAWLGLFLLVFNLTAGATLPVQASPLVLGDPDHIVICTMGGMAVIDRNGTPVTPEHAGVNGFCAACLPFLHGAVLSAAAPPLPQPMVQPIPRAPLAEAEPADRARPLGLAYPRAPPAA